MHSAIAKQDRDTGHGDGQHLTCLLIRPAGVCQPQAALGVQAVPQHFALHKIGGSHLGPLVKTDETRGDLVAWQPEEWQVHRDVWYLP